jgi:hypothetical protein
MTVSSTTTRNEYNGNAATTSFAYTFRILDQSHVSVYVDEVLQTITTDYTVTDVGVSGGGSIEFVVAPASGTGNVVFIRDVPVTQETDYVENDPFPAEAHEEALDKLTMISQQLNDLLLTSLRVPITEGDPGELPVAASRASKYLAFDTNGDAVLTAGTSSDIVVTPFMETVLDDLTASAARTTLGSLGSEDIGVTVQAYDADTLKADTADVLTAGFAATPYNAGTKSSGTYTPDEANGNFQYCVNGGAFTLAPPTNNCTMIFQITNNASAGTITTSGFTKVTGATPGTTNADDFLAYITKINGFSHLAWQALQ